MIVNAKAIIEDATLKNYAIPHFNINNLEWTRFILEECNLNKSPVILGVSESAAKYMGGYKTVANLIQNLDEYLKIEVPVVIHTDHISTVEGCKEAIDNGFTSVMFDGSKYSLEENIKYTKEVVDYAKKHNVTVEAELGKISQNESDNIYTNKEETIKFVKETNIDFLAPSLGSVHGVYKSQVKLNFHMMKEISDATDIPLVLHGGTGISDKLIKKSIANGVHKININTDLQIAWTNAVKKFLENNDVYDPRKIIKSGEDDIKKVIKNKLIIFDSIGKYNNN